MTNSPRDEEQLAELAEREPSDPLVQRWLADHPERAGDLAVARRIRLLAAELRAAEYEVPAGFEARVLARVQQDIALRNLLDFGLNGVGAFLLELLALFFGLTPKPAAPAP